MTFRCGGKIFLFLYRSNLDQHYRPSVFMHARKWAQWFSHIFTREMMRNKQTLMHDVNEKEGWKMHASVYI